MKDPKVILDLALSFADNMVEVLSKKLLDGELSEEERNDIKEKLEDYNQAKIDIYAKLDSTEDTKSFSTSDIDSRLLIVFAVMRKLITKDPTVDYSIIASELEPELPGSTDIISTLVAKFTNSADAVQKAIYRNFLTQLASKKLDYLAEVKVIDYELANAHSLIDSSIEKGSISWTKEEVVQFAATNVGLGYIKSGLNFVIQMVNRMKESENPNKDEIDQYELGIKSVNKLIDESAEDADEKIEDSKTKLFSALTTLGVKTKLFTHAMSNEKFSNIMVEFGKSFKVTSVSHSDEKDVYQVGNDERTLEIVVYYNAESDVFSSISVDGVETDLNELEDMVYSLLVANTISTVETPEILDEAEVIEIMDETPEIIAEEEITEVEEENTDQKEIVVDYDPEEDRVIS